MAPGTPSVPHGKGAGYHSPQSAFAPLVARKDVVAWSVLADVKVRFLHRKIETTYADAVRQLDGKTVRVQGFMTPLEAGSKQSHFLLLSVPPTCPFCVPGGPESMIDVKTAIPVIYTENAVVMEGRFQVLDNDPQGLYYRMIGARAVK